MDAERKFRLVDIGEDDGFIQAVRRRQCGRPGEEDEAGDRNSQRLSHVSWAAGHSTKSS